MPTLTVKRGNVYDKTNIFSTNNKKTFCKRIDFIPAKVSDVKGIDLFVISNLSFRKRSKYIGIQPRTHFLDFCIKAQTNPLKKRKQAEITIS